MRVFLLSVMFAAQKVLAKNNLNCENFGVDRAQNEQ